MKVEMLTLWRLLINEMYLFMYSSLLFSSFAHVRGFSIYRWQQGVFR